MKSIERIDCSIVCQEYILVSYQLIVDQHWNRFSSLHRYQPTRHTTKKMEWTHPLFFFFGFSEV